MLNPFSPASVFERPGIGAFGQPIGLKITIVIELILNQLSIPLFDCSNSEMSSSRP